MTPETRSTLPFFLLLAGLSLPFWLAGSLADRFLPESMPIRLPVSALMAFLPMLIALGLAWREQGRASLLAMLGRAADFRRVARPAWWIVALLLMPAVMLVEYGVLVLRDGPIADAVIPLSSLPVFFVMFLAAGIGEELGWQGYVFERLRSRWTALRASLLIAAAWTVWHVIPFIQTGHDAAWVFWQCACLFPLRIITAWLFSASGGSVLIAALFHAMTNVAEFMFPNYGSHYDPFVTFVILAVVAAAVVWLWGPRTLARWRFDRI